MKPMRLRVVRSIYDPRQVSVRVVRPGDGGVFNARDLQGALTAAGYLPGDIVELTIVSRLGDRDTEVQS